MKNQKKKFESILITGASSGIGEYIAYEFASDNNNTKVLYLMGRDLKKLEKVKKNCIKLLNGDFGSNPNGAGVVKIFAIDVSNKEEMSKVIIDCDNYKNIDLIIANAGINFGTAKDKQFIQCFYEMLSINVLGVINTIFPIIPLFQQRKTGHIAVNASLASYTNRLDCSPYSGSKVLIRFIFEILSWSLKKYYNIDVSIINPGFVKTPMFDKSTKVATEKFLRSKGMSVEKSVKIIKKELEYNTYSIDFPSIMFNLSWTLGSIHPLIRQVFGFLLITSENVNTVWPFPSSSSSSSSSSSVK